MFHRYFSPTELSSAETIAFNAAEQVAPTLREHFGTSSYMTKSDEHDWVTEWDIWAEDQIMSGLSKFSSDVGFLSEESGRQGNEEVYWTVDAIDGTSAFVRGIPTCTTMISLIDGDRPVAAVIYDFVRDIPYTGAEGHGAFEGLVKRLHVSRRPMSSAYIETYVPAGTDTYDQVNGGIRQQGGYILQTGSAGHMFTNIARGATEGFVSVENPYGTIWDYAPGALLVRLAGGVVENVGTPGEYSVENFDMIASNQLVLSGLRSVSELQSK